MRPGALFCFAANLALSFGNPAVALTLMGLESGAQAAYDIGRQGGTFAQQLQGGVASGVLAALIQKMPLAMVRKAWRIQGASGVQRFVKAFVKGALPESGVGFANTVAWNVANRVALGKEADMGKAEFWRDSLKQAFYMAAVGGISGGLIAGVPAGFRGLGTRVVAGTGGLEGELSTQNVTKGAGKTFKFSEMTPDEAMKIAQEYKTKAPIEIPESATIKPASKVGYEQISYNWRDATYKYQVRWHTRTPGAPANQGNTWVIERKTPGSGGVRPKTEILSGNQWVSRKQWQNAIDAYQNGTATLQQLQMLEKGHWKE